MSPNIVRDSISPIGNSISTSDESVSTTTIGDSIARMGDTVFTFWETPRGEFHLIYVVHKKREEGEKEEKRYLGKLPRGETGARQLTLWTPPAMLYYYY